MIAELTPAEKAKADEEALQWGRVQMIAEFALLEAAKATDGAASMGPRSDDRGILSTASLQRAAAKGFNGAAIR